MNRPQAEPERKGRVTKDYQAEYADPIAVEAGEAFSVSAKTSAWENNSAWIWVWCIDQRGKSGWVPKTIIQMNPDGLTGSTQAAYDARELTVAAGQELSIEHEESGWLWCCDQHGRHGWVPISHMMAFFS